MAEHRELVDKRMSAQIQSAGDRSAYFGPWGAPPPKSRGLADTTTKKRPSFGDWATRITADKRHRSSCAYTGIYYADGEKSEGPTRSIEVDRHLGWSIKHDNRLVQNDETITRKIVSRSRRRSTSCEPSHPWT